MGSQHVGTPRVSALATRGFDLNNVRLSSTVTVEDYLALAGNQDREGLSRFVEQRLSERYVAPVKAIPMEKKSGFLIMASACLLIETLESFYQGWQSTEKGIPTGDISDPCKPSNPKQTTLSRSQVAFCYFFHRQPGFSAFRPHADEFYKCVRCGILHQGETTGGWRISRNGVLLDAQNRTINANKFLLELHRALTAYSAKLRVANWDEDVWVMFRQKMNAIIEHCQP
jgi:hypothetical protein